MLLKRTEENESNGAESNIVENRFSDSSCNEGQTTSVNKFHFYKAKNGHFQLLPDNFTFPMLTLSSLVIAWHCGNRCKGIPPYKLLKGVDVRGIKGGIVKLSQMRKLMSCLEKGARIVNKSSLVKSNMTERDARNLYDSVYHLFKIPAEETKKRRYETMSWKSYYNLLGKRKWRLYGEKLENGGVQKGGVERQRSNAKRKRRERIDNDVVIRRKVANQFDDAFDATKGMSGANEQCALGSACKNIQIRQTMCCHREGCDGRIHHLCAIQLNLLDRDNELHVYCSKHCMPT